MAASSQVFGSPLRFGSKLFHLSGGSNLDLLQLLQVFAVAREGCASRQYFATRSSSKVLQRCLQLIWMPARLINVLIVTAVLEICSATVIFRDKCKKILQSSLAC